MTGFTLTGFSQQNNIRRFLFASASDRKNPEFIVEADLGLARKYRISQQELPLMCLQMLEGRPGDSVKEVFLGECEMMSYAARCEVERDEMKRRRRRSTSSSD
jgi:hypothetical protein